MVLSHTSSYWVIKNWRFLFPDSCKIWTNFYNIISCDGVNVSLKVIYPRNIPDYVRQYILTKEERSGRTPDIQAPQASTRSEWWWDNVYETKKSKNGNNRNRLVASTGILDHQSHGIMKLIWNIKCREESTNINEYVQE